MFYIITFANIALFAIISAFHFYWALSDREVDLNYVIPHVDGKPVFVPTRLGSASIGVLLLGASVLILLNAYNFAPFIPGILYKGALGALSVIMLIRAVGDFKLIGFFKKIKSGKFADMDTKFYSPLCLYLCFSCIYLLLNN